MKFDQNWPKLEIVLDKIFHQKPIYVFKWKKIAIVNKKIAISGNFDKKALEMG